MKCSIQIIIFCLISSLAFGQRPTSFSYDPNTFLTEFENFIKTGKGEVKDEIETFSGNYSTGKFSVPQKQQMVKLCNEMLQLQMQPSNEFFSYLKTTNAMVANNQLSKFDNWHKTLIGSIKKNKDEFVRFLNVSRNVFAENIMLRVGSFVWVCEASDIDLKMEGQATFIFKSLNLYCYTPGDTFEIYKTTGKYYAGTNQFSGKGGKLDWTRVGIDSSKVYAKLNNYTINLNDGLMIADSALLTYKDKFKTPILGRVTDKPLGSAQGDKSNYPQFDGYNAEFTGATYGKAKFKGTFALKGALIIGKGSANQKAELYFYFKNKPVLRVASEEFFIRENKITNDKVELTIFLDKDSVYHPQLRFSYNIKEDNINLYRETKTGISAAPFIDYFHNMEIYVDELKWDINNPKIQLDNIASDDPAKFQSINYFREIIYERIQGILDYNPLQRVKTYCEKNNTNTFSIEAYAAAFKSNVSDIKLQMIDLNDRGFLNFNEKKNIVSIKPKLKDYVNAHSGRTDFDAISFRSTIDAIPNAAISLINNDLIIQGVPKFYFSDSQNVYIVPKDQVLTIKKNRAMDFSGKLRAGLADFYGSNFTFDYVKFGIRLNNVDSLKFLYYDDSLGYFANVKSVIQNIYGDLQIDVPYNKGSRKRFPGYPKFNSEVASKIFYDYPTTQKGSYVQDRFYVNVDPFALDSLSDLNLLTLALPGTLMSDGILPDLPRDINLQPDKSLGFFIPKEENMDFNLYKNRGKAKMSLRLSNDGLIGNGEVYYMSSTSTSSRFVFLLDSMNAECEAFHNDRSEKFPTIINSKNVYNHWIPYHDSMLVSNRGEPIKIAYEKTELRGTLVLTPEKMTANGSIKIEDGELLDDNFELRAVEILSKESVFRQRWPGDSTRIAFETKLVDAYLNQEERYGEFTYLKPTEVNNEFYLNNYEGSFEKMRWEFNARTMEFTGKKFKDNPIQASFLTSKKANQDNLTYKAAKLKIGLADYVMHINDVPFINVADSRIIPDSGVVTVRADAEMDEFTNAKIVADTLNGYHKVEQTTVKVNGRTDIKGQGNYVFLDKNKKAQRFYLNEIYIEDKKYVGGRTNIPDSIGFIAGPKLAFQGSSILHSFNKNLEYNGYFKPLHKQVFPKTDWFKSAAVINPDSVYIDLLPPLSNLNRQALYCGVNVTIDSPHVYAAMFTRKRVTSDFELIKVEGTYTYNEKMEEFRVGPYDKVFSKPVRKGNFIALSEAKKSIYAEGKFNFGFDLPKFKAPVAGNCNFNLKDSVFTMHLAMILDFQMPNSAIKLMADTLTEQLTNASNNYYDKQILNLAIPELVDDKVLKKIVGDPSEELTGKLIDDLYKTIFITDLNLKWNQATRSFISFGDIGIRSFDKYLIERKVQGRVEITKRRGNDEIVIYLQQNKGSWYYFKYSKGNMGILSSDPAFNEIIKTTGEKSSSEGYTLRLAGTSDRNKLLKAMREKQ